MKITIDLRIFYLVVAFYFPGVLISIGALVLGIFNSNVIGILSLFIGIIVVSMVAILFFVEGEKIPFSFYIGPK